MILKIKRDADEPAQAAEGHQERQRKDHALAAEGRILVMNGFLRRCDPHHSLGAGSQSEWLRLARNGPPTQRTGTTVMNTTDQTEILVLAPIELDEVSGGMAFTGALTAGLAAVATIAEPKKIKLRIITETAERTSQTIQKLHA